MRCLTMHKQAGFTTLYVIFFSDQFNLWRRDGNNDGNEVHLRLLWSWGAGPSVVFVVSLSGGAALNNLGSREQLEYKQQSQPNNNMTSDDQWRRLQDIPLGQHVNGNQAQNLRDRRVWTTKHNNQSVRNQQGQLLRLLWGLKWRLQGRLWEWLRYW